MGHTGQSHRSTQARPELQNAPARVQAWVRREIQRSGRAIDQASLERLIRHTWPGNVRELENVIERALIRSHEPVLRIDEYDSEAQGSSLEAAPSSNLKEFERRHILQTLTLAGWHIEGPDGAAARLGLPPSTLRSRMKLFGMKRPSVR